MFGRQLATHLRSLPRSEALSRPVRRPTVARQHLRPSPRMYSSASTEADQPDHPSPLSESSDPNAHPPEGGATPPAKSAEHEEVEKKAAMLEARAKELEKDILYHRAEIQTLNRRVIDERAKASEFAITSFARSLLSTSDVLSTALSHVSKPIEPSNAALKDFFSGVELTQKAMFKTFEQHGVRKMELGKGTSFDPNLHEATYQIPKEVAGPKEGGGEWGPGQVVQIGKEGWMIGTRVLRPAQVGVTQME